MRWFSRRYDIWRAALVLNAGLAAVGAGLGLILRKTCTNMEVTGWFMFIAGLVLTIFALGWSWWSWGKEDERARRREDRDAQFVSVDGETVEVPSDY